MPDRAERAIPLGVRPSLLRVHRELMKNRILGLATILVTSGSAADPVNFPIPSRVVGRLGTGPCAGMQRLPRGASSERRRGCGRPR